MPSLNRPQRPSSRHSRVISGITSCNYLRVPPKDENISWLPLARQNNNPALPRSVFPQKAAQSLQQTCVSAARTGVTNLFHSTANIKTQLCNLRPELYSQTRNIEVTNRKIAYTQPSAQRTRNYHVADAENKQRLPFLPHNLQNVTVTWANGDFGQLVRILQLESSHRAKALGLLPFHHTFRWRKYRAFQYISARRPISTGLLVSHIHIYP